MTTIKRKKRERKNSNKNFKNGKYVFNSIFNIDHDLCSVFYFRDFGLVHTN